MGQIMGVSSSHTQETQTHPSRVGSLPSVRAHRGTVRGGARHVFTRRAGCTRAHRWRLGSSVCSSWRGTSHARVRARHRHPIYPSPAARAAVASARREGGAPGDTTRDDRNTQPSSTRVQRRAWGRADRKSETNRRSREGGRRRPGEQAACSAPGQRAPAGTRRRAPPPTRPAPRPAPARACGACRCSPHRRTRLPRVLACTIARHERQKAELHLRCTCCANTPRASVCERLPISRQSRAAIASAASPASASISTEQSCHD